MRLLLLLAVFSLSLKPVMAQRAAAPPAFDTRLHDIAAAPSAARIAADVRKLVSFGTRHTLSDTLSTTRGIGAARRWIRAEFERISQACGGCLEVYEQRVTIDSAGNRRIDVPTELVNVYAVLRGTKRPNDYVIMSGDIDSRISDPMDRTGDSPGANDNASGMAGVLEAARVLSAYRFENSVLLAGLSGEEQGLFGGKAMAEMAKLRGWNIIGVLNNDMIGNYHGIDGVVDNRTFRIFSEPNFQGADERLRIWRRFYGGEVDGASRQLARYVHRITEQYLPQLNPMMIYRLDRFGRGGHHRPFNDAGFAGVRIMEAHEHYDRQHQDIRTEGGRAYGDVLSGVDFDYAARLTAVNACVLASLGWAPPAPEVVELGGSVAPAAFLRWRGDEQADILGYKLYYRLTTEPQWTDYVWVPGSVDEHTMTGLVVDNYFFGVAAVGRTGHESLVVFPGVVLRSSAPTSGRSGGQPTPTPPR